MDNYLLNAMGTSLIKDKRKVHLLDALDAKRTQREHLYQAMTHGQQQSPYQQFKQQYPQLDQYGRKVASGGYLMENIQNFDNALANARGQMFEGQPDTGQGNIMDYFAPAAMTKGISSALKSRGLKGDDLLNAQDMAEELKGVGAEITDDGLVTVYHRTNKDALNEIVNTGHMKAKEPDIFFSTAKNSEYGSGFGDDYVIAQVPIEKLRLDDIFPGKDASVSIRAGKIGTPVKVNIVGSSLDELPDMLKPQSGDGQPFKQTDKIPEMLKRQSGLGDELPINVKSSDVDKIKTGQPITIDYAHNTESAHKWYGKPKKDSPFGRWFEPDGKYLTHVDNAGNVDTTGTMTSGKVTFKNPLVIDNDSLKWKEKLSNQYGGKRGKSLSQALIDDGYDGVVTIDGKHTSEILDLTTFDPKHKPKY